MKGHLLLITLVLNLSPITPCETDDCSCGDWLYDECGHVTPVQALHTATLEECFNNCQLFASFGQCTYYNFLTHNGAHANCLLYNTNAKTYLGTCPVYGQPLYDADGNVLMENCGKFEKGGCKECQNYDATPCGGFHNIDCLLEDVPIKQIEDVSPKENCAAQCREVDGARYSVYNHESYLCECYAAGTRECAQIMVEVDIGTVDC